MPNSINEIAAKKLNAVHLTKKQLNVVLEVIDFLKEEKIEGNAITEKEKQAKKDTEILLKRKDKQILYYTAQRLYIEGLHIGEIEEIIKKAITDLKEEAIRLDIVGEEQQ